MDAKRMDQIKTNLESKDTAELLEIWKTNDREAYSDEAFEAIKLLLGDRSVALPPQSTHAPKEKSVKKQYADYKEVPWHRRSSMNSIFILISFLSGGFIPLTFWTCINLLTGDVYYKDAYDKNGNLKTWSSGNKVAAVIILLLNIVILGFVLIR